MVGKRMSRMSVDDILTTWHQRKAALSPVLQTMAMIRDANNGELIVPLPEMERNERSMIGNLIQTGIERTGQKIASVTPNVWFEPVVPGNRASERRAAVRRRAVLGWWQDQQVAKKMRRRGRWYAGYGSAPVILRPDHTKQIAKWEVRDPLTTYPGPTNDPDEITPPNVLFHFQRTYSWLKNNYPDHLRRLECGSDKSDNVRFDLLEWADDTETVLVCVGKSPDAGSYNAPRGLNAIELERLDNKTGLCLAVVPGRITLDRQSGQFDQMIGPYMAQAKLAALEFTAVRKGVFPATYLVANQGETPVFLAGPFDGASGQVNIIKGGQIVNEELKASYQAGPMQDRLERTQRIMGGLPSEYNGESATNVRTGKRGDAIMAEVVDPVIQEAHEVFALSLQEENKRAIAISKTYFGSTAKTFYVGSAGTAKRVDYIPNRDFEDDNNIVTYPIAGADANGLIVGAGQRMGLGTMSKKTFMELDPEIADPERELARVESEALQAAVLQSLQQQAATGALPLLDIANIVKKVSSGKLDLVDAVLAAQKEAQERQATPAPATAPESQPGLALPGQGAESVVEPELVAEPSDNISNLAELLGGLQRSGRPTRPSPQAVA